MLHKNLDSVTHRGDYNHALLHLAKIETTSSFIKYKRHQTICLQTPITQHQRKHVTETYYFIWPKR